MGYLQCNPKFRGNRQILTLVGGMAALEKTRLLNTINQPNLSFILLMTIQAGGVGIDLTAAKVRHLFW